MREKKVQEQKEEENKIGSGNKWTGRVTVPREPKISSARKNYDEGSA